MQVVTSIVPNISSSRMSWHRYWIGRPLSIFLSIAHESMAGELSTPITSYPSRAIASLKLPLPQARSVRSVPSVSVCKCCRTR